MERRVRASAPHTFALKIPIGVPPGMATVEKRAGLPLAACNPDAAVVAKGDRALAGYLALYFHEWPEPDG